MDLNTSLKTLGRGYAFQAKKLEKLGLLTIKDLLYHIPSRYEDLRIISQIKGLRLNETITIQGEIISIKNEYKTRFMSIQKAVVKDSSGEIECRWFNQRYIPKAIPSETRISISGTVGMFGRVKCISVKEFEVLSENVNETIHTGRLVPIYPLTRGISSKWIRSKTYELLHNPELELSEFLPERLLIPHHLPEIKKSLEDIHFPQNFEDVNASHKRLSYEEFFLMQLSGLYRRSLWEKKKRAPMFKISPYKKEIDELFNSLPFTLTTAQLKALDEIYADLAQDTPMNRLLEGDVGSGKTVVAAIALYVAVLNGYQGVIMAPTEILANQHYVVLNNLLSPLGVRTNLFTSGNALRRNQESRSKNHEQNHNSSFMIHDSFDIAVGTHALLNAKVNFDKLGLVVIDEQQRFGVEQRGILRDKGINPHFLTMTATPIPRTVFLTLYGDLALSLLDEMPKGRIKVKTWLVPNEKRDPGYDWIKKKILETDSEGNKNQVFIICPFIEQSESATTVKAAAKEFERLSKEIFQEFKVGLLHGKMKGKDKDKILTDFAEGKIDVLVATPVVEVGIDIPNATIMVIEAAERFGLSQLHQLRGRVGRRERESFCLLYTESLNQKTRDRLKSLETIYIGAELAELDLKLRGPGDMYGTAQHGANRLKIASFSDYEQILISKKDSEKIFPSLNSYPELKNKVIEETSSIILPD